MSNPFADYPLADEQPAPQVTRRRPPERAPKVDPFADYALADSSEVAPATLPADTAQQRTAQAVAAFLAPKSAKPEDRAQAAAGQPLASGYDGAMQALFPRSYAQIGEDGGADFWTNLKDAWSLPGRAAVGTVGALADLAGSAAASIPRELRGEGDAVAAGDAALGSAWDTFRREMADPSGLMGGNAPGVSNMAAGMVKDPLLPLLTAAMPATDAGMFAGLGKAAPIVRAGASAAEATPLVLGAQAMEKAGTGEEFSLPKETAMAFGLNFVPTALAEALPVVAPWLNKVAKERFTAGIKPRQRTGKEAEGLEKFLEAGGLPKVANFADLQWNRPASRFFQILDEKVGPEYQRALAAADATATAKGMSGMVPKGRMAQGAEQGILDFATERPGAFTAQDMAAARDDVFDRLGMAGADPDAARKIAFGTGNGVAALPTHLMPSEAQRLKSGLAADAYKRKEMSKAVEAAEEGAASAAREILGQKYPEIAALNAAWSPWYAARQAMETARQRGANRGFFTNLRNFPESPGFARGAYEAGRAAGAAGPVLQRFNPLAIPALQIANQNR